jgi:hypothetical protein
MKILKLLPVFYLSSVLVLTLSTGYASQLTAYRGGENERFQEHPEGQFHNQYHQNNNYHPAARGYEAGSNRNAEGQINIQGEGQQQAPVVIPEPEDSFGSPN